jgi:GTP-binding protein
MIQDLGRSLVLVVNKWDRQTSRQRRKIRDEISRKLPFLPDPEILFVSALYGSGLGEIMPAVQKALQSAMVELGTASLNRTLAAAIAQTPPPMYHNRTVKLKFAHQAGKNPPVVVVHGNQAESLPTSYLRYLGRYFAEAYRLRGTRIRIIPRSGENPYARRASQRTQGRRKSPRDRKS